MNEQHPRLSIIVPVYRVEKYLTRCLDSILAQDYSDFELILINDGSPDRCGEIIDKYCSFDSRIIAIHQKNQGVSAARNMGIQKAKGEYIGFVDPDDYISKNMYKTLIQTIEETGSDIACCNWSNVLDKGSIQPNQISEVSALMLHEEFINHLFDIPFTILGVVWNKLFKRSLIKELFPVGCAMGEDTIFVVNYATSVRTACFVNENLYYFFLRPDSAMHANPQKMAEGLNAWEIVQKTVVNEGKRTKRLAEKMYLDKCCLFSTGYDDWSKKAQEKLNAYMKRNLIRVLFNQEIYWKTRLKYIMSSFLLRNKY